MLRTQLQVSCCCVYKSMYAVYRSIRVQICALGSLLVRMAIPAAQVGMGGPVVINPMGPNTVEQIFLAAAHGNVAQAVYNGP